MEPQKVKTCPHLPGRDAVVEHGVHLCPDCYAALLAKLADREIIKAMMRSEMPAALIRRIALEREQSRMEVAAKRGEGEE